MLECLDGLRLPVLENVEVLRGQIEDRLTVSRGIGVYADEIGFGTEYRRLLLLLRRRRRASRLRDRNGGPTDGNGERHEDAATHRFVPLSAGAILLAY